MRKDSYIDHQENASNFSVGDTVLLPIFTRGNRYAPHYGRVTSVLDGIGMIDVQTPMGNIRMEPHTVVKDNKIDSSHLSTDTSYDSYDKTKDKEGYTYANPKKVASRYMANRMPSLIKKAFSLLDEGLSPVKAYHQMWDEGKTSDGDIKNAVKMATLKKQALYWRSKGRQYIPTQKEIESGVFHCPHCKTELERGNYKKYTKLYICPECLWMIRPDDLVERETPDDVMEPDEEIEPGVQDWFTKNDPILKQMYGDGDE